MALNANALTTVATCKTQLDIQSSDTSQDALLERFINSASEQVERYCGRKFALRSFVEVRDGTRSNEMLLENWPVVSVTSVHVDTSRAFGAESLLLASEYGVQAPNILRRHDAFWPRGSMVVRVEYTAGYATIPADLEDACVMLVEHRYRMKNDRRLGRTSSGKQGESISYTETWPQEVLDLLEPYRNYSTVLSEMARLV